MRKQLSVLLLSTLVMSQAFAQDMKLPSLSPKSTLRQEFSTSFIEIDYSRPSARGRNVYGDVITYGEVWRTGANAATTITFGEDVIIGGKTVKAGKYSLYTIPNKEQWEIIINENTGNWGAAGYDTDDDVVRLIVKARTLKDAVQTFTINIDNIGFNSCEIHLSWGKTLVAIPVTVNNQERINAYIERGVNQPSVAYHQAAGYYFETGTNLDKAYEYINKAIDQNPKAFYLYHHKAKIAAKMGKKDEAIKAAMQSTELAKGTPYEQEYARNNDKLIKSIKK